MTPARRNALLGLLATIVAAALGYFATRAGIDLNEDQVRTSVEAGLHEALDPDSDTEADSGEGG